MSSLNIIDFKPEHAGDFKRMNIAWITQHWELEPEDVKALDNPDEYILRTGGAILIALYNNNTVGSTALIPYDKTTLELAKMTVTPDVRGKGFGFMLGIAALERAKKMGAHRVYLESNSILAPALSLYQKLGFTDVQDTRKPSPYDRCDVCMEKIF